MKTFVPVTWLAALAAIVFAVGSSRLGAEDLGAVKQRMVQRLAAVDELKDHGMVGEDNRGFLEPRSSLSDEARRTVEAENADRGTVYAALAEQTGSTPQQVGRARARQIAQNSRPGVWLQAEDGRWYRK